MGKESRVAAANITRMLVLLLVFAALTMLLVFGFISEAKGTDDNIVLKAGDYAYPVAMSMLLAGLATFVLNRLLLGDIPGHTLSKRKKPWWLYPLSAGLLAFYCMLTAYLCMGIWPAGERSILTVDMHHQYAPLLAQLRSMMRGGGGSLLYTFEAGLGTSFLPLFGYYLASPFNFILALFPFSMLNEAILLITLLKNAFCAFAFALCVQYIFRRMNPVLVFTSIMYSMMMYLLAYSWNIMWLDGLIILPLAVMALERMLREGKYVLYIFSVAYALYSNYYIGFMICIFLALYWVVYMLREKRAPGLNARAFVRFAVGSLLGGGLAMVLVIPVYLSLADTSAAGGKLPEMAANFPAFDLFGNHLYESMPTIRSGTSDTPRIPSLPNIYCGLLSVILLPIFATLKSIPLRRRIAYLSLLGVMAASFVLNQPDLIWHGLHAPNDLPFRFSFLYSFVLLLITAETLMNLRHIKTRQISGVLAGIVVLILIYERLPHYKETTFEAVYVSILLAVAYAAILALVAKNKLAVRGAHAVLLLVVVAEMVFNGGATFKTLHSNEYFTARNSYVANDTTEAIAKAVSAVKTYERLGSGFYRMDFTPRRTTVDTAMFDYSGLTVFASSNPKSTTTFLDRLGYANNGVNSYLYKSFVPMTDALFGLKYYITDTDASGYSYLTKRDSFTSGDQTYTIYENSQVLPIGYVVSSEVKEFAATRYDPIATHNDLYSALLGEPTELYSNAILSTAESAGEGSLRGGSDTGFSVSLNGTSGTGSFEASVTKSGQVFVYVDCSAADSISISTGSVSESPKPRESHMVNAGYMNAGEKVSITVSTDTSCSGNIYVVTLDEDVFNQGMEKLKSRGMQVSKFTDTKITGTVNAGESGVFLTSIPYDSGWTVKVDGKKVDLLQPNQDENIVGITSMVAFDIGEGSHEIEMTFFPKGLISGALISVFCLAATILLAVFLRRKVDGSDPENDEFAYAARLLSTSPAAAPAPDANPVPDGTTVSHMPLYDPAAGDEDGQER